MAVGHGVTLFFIPLKVLVYKESILTAHFGKVDYYQN